MYSVRLEFFSECYYPLPRKHDVGLMNILVDREFFSPAELSRINRVRHFHGIFVLSELTHCDGITLRREFLSLERPSSESHHPQYPLEHPTASDFNLWKTALFTVFSSTLTLNRPLGKYLCHPPRSYIWLYSSGSDLLSRRISTNLVAIYVKSQSGVTRSNTDHYTFSCTASEPPSHTHFASVISSNASAAVVHSFTPIPSFHPSPYRRCWTPCLIIRCGTVSFLMMTARGCSVPFCSEH